LPAKDSLVTGSLPVDQRAITRAATVARGRSAPGWPGRVEAAGAVRDGPTAGPATRRYGCRPCGSSPGR